MKPEDPLALTTQDGVRLIAMIGGLLGLGFAFGSFATLIAAFAHIHSFGGGVEDIEGLASYGWFFLGGVQTILLSMILYQLAEKR